MCLIYSAAGSAAGMACRSLFFEIGPVYSKFHKKLSLINPELALELAQGERNEQTLKGLYFLLKEEGWRVNPRGMVPWREKAILSEEVQNRIISSQPSVYNLSQLNEEDVYHFYGNAIQGLYIAVSEQIKKDFVAEILGDRVPQVQRNHFIAMLELTLFPGLGKRDLSPERAEEVLSHSLSAYNWKKLAQLSNVIFAVEESLRIETLKEEASTMALSEDEERLFLRALEKPEERRVYCCLNSPGCLFCPNNRSFLNK